MNRALATALALCSTLSLVPGAAAAPAAAPGYGGGLRPLEDVERLVLPPVDVSALRADDAARSGAAPLRFAAALPVDVEPLRAGTWDALAGGGRLWRLRVVSAGALSLNFAFDRFRLPHGARLRLYHPVTGFTQGPYTWRDNAPHGQLWTPVVLGDEAVLELFVPAAPKFEPELHLAGVQHGYRFFAEPDSTDQGSCNVDVICPEGDEWRREIRSVGVYSLGGSLVCTGQMLNSVAGDARNLFLTANHCGVRSHNAPSLVVYWNYESPECGLLAGGVLQDNQTGATFRAAAAFSDFTLVELEEPPDPAWNVSYSGWDATGDTPPDCVAIHHPGTDEKAISFNEDPLISDSYLGGGQNDHSHWKVDDWELGTTEPGSSGSGIWNAEHRLVGQLHGGYASCSSLTADWYGKLSVSWDGGRADERLRDWLDPDATGTLVVDTADPNPPAPLAQLDSYRIRDSCAGTSNGVLEPGETLRLRAVLGAVNGDLTNVRGTLVALTPGVTVTTPTATWPDIPAGAVAPSAAPHLAARLGTEVPCDGSVAFRLDLDYDQGSTSVELEERVGSLGTPAENVSADVPKAIPDDDPGGVESTLTVGGDAVIAAAEVAVAIQHSYVGDLVIELVAPDATAVRLLDRPGRTTSGFGCGDNGMRVLFTDTALIDPETHCRGTTPWLAGPGLPFTPLAVLAGEPAAGTWTLRVADLAGIDVGQIAYWSLHLFEQGGGVCETCTAAGAD